MMRIVLLISGSLVRLQSYLAVYSVCSQVRRQPAIAVATRRERTAGMAIGKRVMMRGDKEVGVIMSSLAKASEAAIETTLNGIVDKLKSNAPLMYHIHALLNNEEWTGVLEASISGSVTEQTCGEKPDKEWKLRSTVKKFIHPDRLLKMFVILKWV